MAFIIMYFDLFKTFDFSNHTSGYGKNVKKSKMDLHEGASYTVKPSYLKSMDGLCGHTAT